MYLKESILHLEYHILGWIMVSGGTASVNVGSIAVQELLRVSISWNLEMFDIFIEETQPFIPNVLIYRVVHNFLSRRRLNRSRRLTVVFLTLINNEYCSIKGLKGGLGVWKYAFIRWSFCHTVVNISSILHVYTLYRQIFLWSYKKVDGARDLSSWRYRHATLLLDNHAYRLNVILINKLSLNFL